MLTAIGACIVSAMTAPAPTAPVFFPLIPETGYWVGAANHACADPEYVLIPEHFPDEVATADYCPGYDGADRRMWDSLCPACAERDDELPF